MKIKSEKYFLKDFFGDGEFREVSKELYMKAENQAGFFSKEEGEPATGSFANGIFQGRSEIKYDWGDDEDV